MLPITLKSPTSYTFSTYAATGFLTMALAVASSASA
jgi:hypothetical protein